MLRKTSKYENLLVKSYSKRLSNMLAVELALSLGRNCDFLTYCLSASLTSSLLDLCPLFGTSVLKPDLHLKQIHTQTMGHQQNMCVKDRLLNVNKI